MPLAAATSTSNTPLTSENIMSAAHMIAIASLTSGTVYYFRFRGVTKTGEGAYSQVVQLLVL